MNNPGFIFKGKNTTDVLKQVWKAIEDSGNSYQSQKGLVKSIKGVSLVINNPLDESKNYPYWDKASDNWYQDTFVRKETTSPPETLPTRHFERSEESLTNVSYIFPYKYAWRSRYYDSGSGYVKAVCECLKKLKVQSLKLKIKADLKRLMLDTYYFLHPEILLAVLSWKGLKLINFYLKNPEILDEELNSNRIDTLEAVINELKNSPTSRRAITPSFIYPNIDLQGPAGGVPVYQNYQLYINFDKNGKATGLTSFHLHRAFDAYGGLQLDINHDKDWGIIASKKLGLPLEQIVIYGNDVWANKDKKTDIKNWLLAATNAYDPKKEDIEKRLSSENFKKKIEYACEKLVDN